MIDTIVLLIILSGSIMLSLILTTAFVWAINRRLSKQINVLTHVTEQVAAGDLSIIINTEELKELAGLATSFNKMVAALHSSRAEFQTIYDTANAIILAHNENFEIIYMNPYACKVLEYELNEMMGKNINTMIEDSEVRRADPIREQVAIDPELRIEGFEQYYLKKNGGRVLINWNVTALKDMTGKAVGILGVGQDITERKKAEEELMQHRNHLEEMVAERTAKLTTVNAQLQQEIVERHQVETALRENEARYRELFDTMTSGVAVYEAVDEGQDFIFQEFNRAGEHIEGVNAKTVIGKRVTEVFPGIAAVGILATFQRVWQSGQLEHTPEALYEDERQGKTWREYWVYKLPSGEIVTVYNDITGRKQEKEELRQAKETAEAANRAKSTFLANMSHEFRTPLNGILGYTQILKQTPATSLQQERGLNIIQKSGEHLLLLINDILDLAKVEAGKIELQIRPFDLPNLVSNVCEMVQTRAKAKNLACIKQTGSLPHLVLGDEKRLGQVLVNLLGNGIKFTNQGGVTLRVEMLPDENNLCRFQVIDTGIGIAPEYMATIFDPFEQVSGYSHSEKGTGLGLAISWELVELMGGTLQVKSELNQGSTFWFDVPLPEIVDMPQLVAPLSRSITGINGQSPRVLVVDDNADNRHVVIDMLRPLGFIMAEAENGEEGVTQAATFKPDAIILDLVMPKLNGLAMIKAIRGRSEFNKISLIVSSASSYDEDKAQSLSAGANAFVPKPVDINLLLDTLQQQLQLEWAYSDDEIASEPFAPLVWPPLNILSELVTLAQLGDIAAMRQYINTMKEYHPQWVTFAIKLQHLIDTFQLNQLLSFLESHPDETDESQPQE